MKVFWKVFCPGHFKRKILSLMTQFGGKRHHSLTSFKIQCKSIHKVNIVVLHLPTFEGLFVTVWPDLPKFHHFGKMLKIFGNFFRVTLVFGKNLEPTLENSACFGPNHIVVNGQILGKHSQHLVTLVWIKTKFKV